MDNKNLCDIRWKQRFRNFENALNWLEKSLDNSLSHNRIEQAGTVHFFEICFELSWKVLKDFLEYNGHIDINSPRTAIKGAISMELIEDGHNWMEMLKDRNLTAHIYDEDTATYIYDKIIVLYHTLFKDLQKTLYLKL